MNIFTTSPSAYKSAWILDDKRVNKMIIESAQILSTTIHLHTGKFFSDLLKPTHTNHPIVRWAMKIPNWSWLLAHFNALLWEFNKRYQHPHTYDTRLMGVALGLAFRRYVNPENHQMVLYKPNDFYNCTPFPELPTFFAYRKTLVSKWQQDKRPPTWHRKQIQCRDFDEFLFKRNLIEKNYQQDARIS